MHSHGRPSVSDIKLQERHQHRRQALALPRAWPTPVTLQHRAADGGQSGSKMTQRGTLLTLAVRQIVHGSAVLPTHGRDRTACRWRMDGSDLHGRPTARYIGGTEIPSASAMTGRVSCGFDHLENHARSRSWASRAPRQRRGRNAATAVSASTSEPIGRIGPCALNSYRRWTRQAWPKAPHRRPVRPYRSLPSTCDACSLAACGPAAQQAIPR